MDIDDVAIGRDHKKKPRDLVDLLDFGIKYTTVRLLGDFYTYGGHWVKTKTKDGKSTQFYTVCSAFDRDTGRRDSTKKCAWCDHEGEEVRFAVDFYSNGISRKEQKSKPEDVSLPNKSEAASGFKEKDSDSWTPVRAIRMPSSVVRSLKELKELNVHEDAEGTSKAYGVSHPKYGFNVMIKKDPDAAPAQMYSVQKGDSVPLRKEERAYLQYDLTELQEEGNSEAIQKDYSSWAKRMGYSVAGEDKAVKGKGSKAAPEDDEEDEFDDDPKSKKKVSKKAADDFDDDEDEPPKKKPASKKKPVADDEDDDESTGDADFDDDEEDEPPKKKKPVASKKKPAEEDDFDDEEEDEPPKKKAAAKKKPLEDDDFDDDEEDEPPKKSSKKKPVAEDDEDDGPPKKRLAAKKKPSLEDDDDEDDEPPKKKVAAKKKSAPIDEDDEDDIPY